MHKQLKVLCLLSCLSGWSPAQSETTSMAKTQNKLRALNSQIQTLKNSLSRAEDKRGLLTKELAENEKQMGEAVKNLHQLQQDIDTKRQKIALLQLHETRLNKQLATQQQLLAEHIRLRHRMGAFEPIKWMINQDNPYTITRLFTFHQYIVQSRQKIIAEIDSTKKHIASNQVLLKAEIDNTKTLQNRIHHHQAKLENDRQYHKEVLGSLSKDIQSKERELSGYEQNKANLSRLMNTLSSQSALPDKPVAFSGTHRKLPGPLPGRKFTSRPNSQGVLFMAPEGTAVHAVAGGKIVFSDWLNGYGLLLIIDHGQGFMTLYAHNQSLFKHKGTLVVQGEQIASVGHSGGSRQNGLYFEVRQHGKAVSAARWLT